jgi:heparinase II/III-like protein
VSSRAAHLGLLDAAAFGSFLLVILFLWAPVVRHYYIEKPAISDEVLSAARSSPSDEVLRELGSFRFFGEAKSGQQLVATAEELLRGILELPGRPPMPMKLPFDPTDLDREGLQLFVARFGVPRLLLEAYVTSGREEFLHAAREYLLAWIRYEERAWLPRGLVWNDHTVAERVLILAEFWRLYRQHPRYEPEVGRRVIELAARYSVLLAKPSHFTFNTNHGVMQNLALFHFCLAFPVLPGVEHYKRLAFERLNDQLHYYINDEGVVLEHSPGYHRVGLEFLSKAMRYLTLLGISPPLTWIDKYSKAKSVYAQLRLPDGLLPLFGDTRYERDARGPLVANLDPNGKVQGLDYQRSWVPLEAAAVYPVAGYAVWWDALSRRSSDETRAQTVIGWSHFPGHGHLRANQMSIWVWARGQVWWSNVGYWPYDHKDRPKALSWSTSNAPHLVNEHPPTSRRAALRSLAWSDKMAFIDLERSGPGGYIARRQVLWRKPALWLVLDGSTARNGRQQIVWTTSPDVRMDDGPVEGSLTLHGADANVFLDVFLLGSSGTSMRTVRGSHSPFAGWGVVGSRISHASSVVVEQPATNAWALAVSSLHTANDRSGRIRRPPSIIRMENTESWKVALQVTRGYIAIERRGDEIVVLEDSGGNKTRDTLILERAGDDSGAYKAIRNSYLEAKKKYPGFHDHYRYRIRLTWLLVGVFALQETLLAYLRTKSDKGYAVARWLSLCCWLGGGVAMTSYFSALVHVYTQLSCPDC